MNIFVNEISLQFRDFYLDELSKTEKLQLYTSKQHVAFSRQLTYSGKRGKGLGKDRPWSPQTLAF